jgi:hypothetical protein
MRDSLINHVKVNDFGVPKPKKQPERTGYHDQAREVGPPLVLPSQPSKSPTPPFPSAQFCCNLSNQQSINHPEQEAPLPPRIPEQMLRWMKITCSSTNQSFDIWSVPFRAPPAV